MMLKIPPPAELAPAQEQREPLPFFMYTTRALDFSWLRACDEFAELERLPRNERLAEVAMYDLLRDHPRELFTNACQ